MHSSNLKKKFFGTHEFEILMHAATGTHKFGTKRLHCKYLRPIYSHLAVSDYYNQWQYVHMKLTDIEENSLRLDTVLDCAMYNQIAVGNTTLPKAVLSMVKIFSV